MKRISSLLLAAVLALAALAGCGGDDALTKSEYVEQANEICRDAGTEIDAQGDELFSGGEPPSPEAFQAFVDDVLVPNVEGQLEDLRELEPPEGDEDQVNAILDEVENGLDEAREADNPIDAFGSFTKANELAADYGLDVCAG